MTTRRDENAPVGVGSGDDAVTARLAAIVQGSDDAIFTKTLDGTITSWNPGAARLYGYTAAEIVGSSVAILVPPQRQAEVFDLLARVARGQRVRVPDTARVRKDGTVVHVSLSLSPVRDRGGAVVEVATIAHDIGEQRRAGAELSASEDRFRYAFDHSPVGKSITLPSGEVSVNHAFCEMLGYTEQELEHTRWQDFTPPEDVPLTEARLEPLLAGTTDHVRFEKRYLRKDGSVVWADVATSLRREADGTPLYFVTAVVDVTQRKLAETALRAGEARYRELVDHMTSGVVVYEPTADGRDFVIGEFNAAAQRIEQIARDAVVGRLVTEAFPGVEGFGLLDVLRRVAATGAPERFPTALYRDDRLETWRDNSVYRLPSGEVVAVYEDVTERVRAELAAAKAKALLERAEEVGRTGGWEYDVATDTIEWTDEVYRIHGVDRGFDPASVTTDLGFYTPSGADAVGAAFRRAVETAEPYDLEVELRRADGEVVWVRTIGRPVVRDGAVTAVVGSIAEITERKRAELALHDSERKLRRFYEAGIVGVIYWTTDGAIVDANDRFLEMTGYTRQDLEAGLIDWAAMTPPEYRHLDERSLVELRETGANAVPFEKEYLRKDGTRLPVVVAGAMLDDEFHSGIALVLDISERRQAEEALRHLNAELEDRVRQRTAALEAANKELEAFAYSVSHDLRAPLRHIGGYAGLLERRAGDALGPEARQWLDNITGSAQEMGVLIDDLLQFSRIGRAELRITDVDMTAALDEALAPLRDEAAGRAIAWDIGPLPHVSGDAALLRQVWANLLDNAVKYTRDRDPAHISVGALGDGQAAGDGSEVVFYVRDDGVGFDMRYVHKLFGVFQRLHSAAEFEGTGIGLANVDRIVRRLDGRVWAESAPGAGATFYFALPSPKEQA